MNAVQSQQLEQRKAEEGQPTEIPLMSSQAKLLSPL
jgi:hypothetical protein